MSETIQSIDLDPKSFEGRNIIKYDKYIQIEQNQGSESDELIKSLEKDLNKLGIKNKKHNKALSQKGLYDQGLHNPIHLFPCARNIFYQQLPYNLVSCFFLNNIKLN